MTNPARRLLQSLVHAVREHIHKILALATLVSGLWFIAPLAIRVWAEEYYVWFRLDTWRDVLDAIGLSQLPRVVISLSLVLMAFGLLSRARVAWTFSLIMLVPAVAISIYTHSSMTPDAVFNLVLLFLLILNWSAFSRSSVAAGTLFALSAVISLLWYAVLGTLYLGHEFAPKVDNLTQAIYFSLVAISTVGFGDIVPASESSRMFVVSIIILGVTVFATAVGAVLIPVVGGALGKMLQRKVRLSMKTNHTIICGATPLAMTVYENLVSRGEQVTVIVHPDAESGYPEKADIIIGDASSEDVLRLAGVDRARYVLAMRQDDPDNAFIVLAVKSYPGCQAKTVAVVNHQQNLEKVRMVNPDMLFSPQQLGAELLSRILRGEPFDKDLIAKLFVASPVVAEDGNGTG